MTKSKFSEEQFAYALCEVAFAVSCVQAYHLAQFSRAAWYRRSTRDDQTRALERPSIHVDRGCADEDRSLAGRPQSASATQLARPCDTERVRTATSEFSGRFEAAFLVSG